MSIRITWFATASIAVETDTSSVLIDPFVTFPGSEYHTALSDFARYPSILLTHGHLDHLASIPELLKVSPASVFCTATPMETLMKQDVPSCRLRRIQPGDSLTFGDIQVTAFQGRHIHFDPVLIFHTVCSRRMLHYARNLPYFLHQNRKCQENGEILAFRIQAEGKQIFLLGSLGLDEHTDYPTGMDLLVLPCQGATDLISPCCDIIRRLAPQRVLLDHCDDAFPPITQAVDVLHISSELRQRFPNTEILLAPHKGVIQL